MNDYDYYLVAFSGGKDSIACFLHLLDIGIPKNKIEIWHHCIDGKGGATFMDWPVTEDYCKKFAEAFDIPIYYSWKEGGFIREMLRENQPTAPTHFEYPEDDLIEYGLTGGKGPLGTRLKFPQVSADLRVRWCSAYLIKMRFLTADELASIMGFNSGYFDKKELKLSKKKIIQMIGNSVPVGMAKAITSSIVESLNDYNKIPDYSCL